MLHHEVTITARNLGGSRVVRDIVVVKLDHLGDFITCLRALEQLREAFADARIRMICGPWNRDLAQASGLVDEVFCYTYFPQNARDWDGQPCQDVAVFADITSGHWDLAIDLRVDEDTRFLLRHVDADLRCGMGTRERHPFLDIILPPELERRFNTERPAWAAKKIGVEHFSSTMPTKTADRHETDFRGLDRILINGPGVALPRGKFRVLFDCDIRGRGFGARHVALTFGAYAHGAPVATLRLEGRRTSDLAGGPATLEFRNDVDGTRFDFRIASSGRPLVGRFGFSGCRLETLDTPLVPRLRRVELHIGEKLSLLVCLINERTRAAQNPVISASWPDSDRRERPAQKLIAIAPISNSTLRDWPPAHYTALMQLLADRLDCRILLIGTLDQAAQIGAMIPPSAAAKIDNLAGQVKWSALAPLLHGLDLVICNNSGIAHLAAAIGARVLALYSASHEAAEWGPRGAFSRVLTAQLACAPCGHDILTHCLYQHACMQGLRPELVFREACAILDRAPTDPVAPSVAEIVEPAR